MSLGFPRILLITVFSSWVLAGLRFLVEWIGIPVLPWLFDPVGMMAMAAVAGAMIALEAGRYDVPPPKWMAIMALYCALSRVAIGGLMLLAASMRIDSGLGHHDGSLLTVVLRQLLWAGVTFVVALIASAVAQRVVKEVSERPTGQM